MWKDSNKAKQRWDRCGQIIDISAKALSAIAVVVSAWWAWDQFHVQRTNSENLTVLVHPTVGGLESKTPVLVINVAIKNIGKVPVWAGQFDDPEWGSGCELTVLEYADAAKGGSDKQRVIDWKFGGGGWQSIVTEYNLLEQYYAFQHGNYMLNPGVEYNETAVVPVKKGALYGIRARFFAKAEWTMTDIAYVFVE